MINNSRRDKIIQKLNEAVMPISASKLAKEFGVSRQVIVGDISLLRASGYKIEALPKGYLLVRNENIYTIVCQHTESETFEELSILVKHHIEVLDVKIDHHTYGVLTGELNIKTQQDIIDFLALKPNLLSKLTNGIHIHTLKVKDKKDLDNALIELRAANFLYES